MKLVCKLLLLTIPFVLATLIGCSEGNNPSTPISSNAPFDTIPIVEMNDMDGVIDMLGTLSAYQLTIDPETMTADLVSKRFSTIGESYLISGLGFFIFTPCKDCLKLTGFGFSGFNIMLEFKVDHPFKAGDPLLPPTAMNRLDLDIFDLAMVIMPHDITPTSYALTGANIYTDVVSNASGYTRELAEATADDAAMPYVLVVDDSVGGTSTWNKFAMGESAVVDVAFMLSTGIPLTFDMYLTMGYGASAKRPQRLEPKYYNPEFNRKAAWKVKVTPPEGSSPPAKGNTWDDTDNATKYNVMVGVYDWQTLATVYPISSDFENAPADNVYTASEVESVSVEIPGMNDTLPQVSTPVSGDGMPDNPLVYKVSIANANLLPAGSYLGLVKVTDTRNTLIPPPSGTGDRDFLIDSPFGIELNNYAMSEYATYQTFTATVVERLTPVGDVRIKVNRTTTTYGYPFNTSGPWTLSWDDAGAVEYAIYYDTDYTDGYTNNLSFVGTTTSTSYTVPTTHLDPDHYNGDDGQNGYTYIVRSRSIAGDPASELADSEPAFIKYNGWETLSANSIIGQGGNEGEGWEAGIEGSSYNSSVYYYYPYVSASFAAHGSNSGSCIGAWTGWSGSSYPGLYSCITTSTPINVPDSTVRFIDFSFYTIGFFALNEADPRTGGMIIGTCSMQPSTLWANPSSTFEWALALNDSTNYNPPLSGYTHSVSYVNTSFFNVDTSSAYCWSWPQFGLSPAWVNSSKRLGGDLNATANPVHPYVGIAAARSASGTTTETYTDDIAILIY